MDCQIRQSAGVAEVVITGSLDSSWSPYLSDRLDEVIRAGVHEVCIDMADLTYLSSNGIALLVRYHRQLRQIGGRFRVVGHSEEVGRVLELSGIARLLRQDEAASEAPASGATRERAGMSIRVFGPAASTRAPGRLGLIGDPARLAMGGYGTADDRPWRATPGGIALGLGALGPGFEACRDRYGEFLGVAGVAVYRPGVASGRPDLEQTAGAFQPVVRVLYGLTFAIGPTAGLVRFEPIPEPASRPVPLSELAQACLDESGADAVGMVLVGETAGLVGAALRRSPVHIPDGTDPFAISQARDWLSMTPEPEHARSTALAVGVATRSAGVALAPFVRRLSAPDSAVPLWGHFHAAAVPFRPLPSGPVEMEATVHHLFEPGRVETVLHLLNDSRPIVGAGESTFRRGACWFVPLALED